MIDMKTAEIKLDLHNKIDNVPNEELEDIYGLIMNYLNSKYDIEEFDLLPEYQKRAINKGFEQAESGMGTPLKEINKRLRNKYGIYNPSDWWDQITKEEQTEIKEGLAQADNGEVLSHEEVMAKYQKWRSK